MVNVPPMLRSLSPSRGLRVSLNRKDAPHKAARAKRTRYSLGFMCLMLLMLKMQYITWNGRAALVHLHEPTEAVRYLSSYFSFSNIELEMRALILAGIFLTGNEHKIKRLS